MQNDRSLRIRTAVGEYSPNVVNVKLTQTYDSFEILSLKIDQANMYKLFQSDYGVIVGRVNASGNFGVPNAKVSLFIPVKNNETTLRKIIYGYKSIQTKDTDGIRYNLLPNDVINACYQNVGTFPDKRLLLDNKDYLEIFDDYFKYTTVTNASGDYMLFGVPTGQQTLHVDIDLSDIGPLSQRPRDMMYQGFNINQFESPNKYKRSTDLDSLAQIKSQSKGVDVFPFWGDTTSDGGETIGITRCDIQVQYNFQPTAIFMGSVISDNGTKAISKNCVCDSKAGKMNELVTGEGTIEMVRKRFDGRVEEFQIRGNRLINGDGIWCYQIPMNLDYMMTDEFGNMVPTDNPNKGIPTRARVRFRIGMDGLAGDGVGRKRAMYLVPNNPRIDSNNPEFIKKINRGEAEIVDYEFGSLTSEESFRDLMWNNVYTVKSYIPRLQASNNPRGEKYTGIKRIRDHGSNNPFPYNNMRVRLSLPYIINCIVVKFIISLVVIWNKLITVIAKILGVKIPVIKVRPFAWIGEGWLHCMGLPTEMCQMDDDLKLYYPGCNDRDAKYFNNYWFKEEEQKSCNGDPKSTVPCGAKPSYGEGSELINCVENQLAEEYDAVRLLFANDWVNGTMYFPMWHRRIKSKRKYLFGLIKVPGKDDWCSTDGYKSHWWYRKVRPFSNCAMVRGKSLKDKYINEYGKTVIPNYVVKSERSNCTNDCQDKNSYLPEKLNKGLIKRKDGFDGIDVFYYSPIQFTDKLHKNEYAEDNLVTRNGELTLLFATDLVLLGSFNECDSSGVSGVFDELTSSSFIIPEGLRSLDGTEPELVLDANGKTVFRKSEAEVRTEFSGMDWGLANSFDQYSRVKWKNHGLLRIAEQQSKDGGLFYGIGCTIVETLPKSCLNLSRVCEFGVRLDESNEEVDVERAKENYKNEGYILSKYYSVIAPDGYISFDDIEDFDSRSEFATMNYNGLVTKFDSATNGYKYDFNYLYLNNFDGSMRNTMEETQSSSEYRTHKVDEGGLVSYRFNYLLEDFSRDYYRFRMGKAPYNYDKYNNTFPRYENSLYFYFGLFDGKTALDKFNSDFNSDCRNITEPAFSFKITNMPNSWCKDILRDKDKSTSGDNRNGVIAFDFDGISTPFKIILSNRRVKDSVIEIDNISLEKFYLMSNTDYTNPYSGDFIKDLHSEGYVHAEAIIPSYNSTTGELESGVSIPNGLYDVYIVDNEGNVETAVLDFRASYLSYNTDNTRTFIKEYKYILHDFKVKSSENICSRIAKYPETGTNRNIGGYIVIDELINDNKDIIREGLLEDYLIEVESDRPLTNCSELNNDNIWYTSIDRGKTDGNSFYLVDTIDNSIKIGIPEAPMSYTVRITELCDGVSSQNSVETTVFIKEPEPVRLFVNSVDHELITGKNWDLITSGANTGSVLRIANTKNNGWFRIQDKTSYDWEKYPEYKEAITSDESNQDVKKGLIDKIKDSIDKLNGLSNEFDRIKTELKKKREKREEINQLIIDLNKQLSSGNNSENDADNIEAQIDAKEDELNDVEDKIDELLMELSTISSNVDDNGGIDTGEQKTELIDTINSTILQVVSTLNLSSTNINALKLYMHEQDIPISSVLDDYIEENDLTVYSLLTELIDLIIEDVGSVVGNCEKGYEYTEVFGAILGILSKFEPREAEFVKEDIISKMVNGFVFTSFDEVKSLTLSVTGDKQIYPIQYYMKYTRQGSTDEDRFKYVNTHYYISDVVDRNLRKINKGEPNTGTIHLINENSVDGIGLPNISTTDNIVYRQNLAPNSGLTPNTVNGFGIHPLKDYEYVDSDGNTIGSNNHVLIYRYGILAQDGEINLPMSSISNGNLIDESAGTAIFIDKILRLNMLSWAAFTTEGDGIPRLDITQNLEKEFDPNRWIYSVGMFASDITNGVAKQMEDKRLFTTQTLDEELFDIIYLNYKPNDYNMEADLIVKGIVTRGKTLDSYKVGNVPAKVYEGYRLDSMLKSDGTSYYGSQTFDTDHQFIDLTNESVLNLLIRQYSGSFLNEEIYGNMRLFPGSDVQFDIYFDDSVLSKMYNYILPGPKQESGYKYISKFNLKSNVDANYDSYLFDWKWNYDMHPIASIEDGRFTYKNAKNLFDVDTPIEVIRDRSYKFKIDNINKNSFAISEYNSKHDSSLTVSIFGNNEDLFKTIGEANEVPFTRLMYQRAIAVGITENNCRTITPIYDFSPRSVDLYFITLKGKTSESNRYFIGFAASNMKKIKVNGELKDVMIDPRVGDKHVNNNYIQYLPHSVVGTVWLRRDDEVKVGGKKFSFGGGEQLLTPSVPSFGAEYGRNKLSDFAYTEIRLEPVEGEETKPEESDEDKPAETMGGSYFEHIRKKANDKTDEVHRLLFEGNASWMAAKNWADNQKVYIIDASGIKVQAFISNIFFKDFTLESNGKVNENEPKPVEPTPSEGTVYLDASKGVLGMQFISTEYISGSFVIDSGDEQIDGVFYTDEEYDYAQALSWCVKTYILDYKYNTSVYPEGSNFSGTLSLTVNSNTSQEPNPTIGLNFDGNTYRNGDTISFTRTNNSRISVSVDIN